MRRREDTPRIYGPYKHGEQHRVHIVTRRGGARQTSYQSFETRALAEAFLAGARDEAQGRTVGMAIDAFIARTRERGRAPNTIANYEDRLANLLGPIRSRPLRAVVGRGAELYAAAQLGRKPDTHRGALGVCKTWGKWCVKQRWLRANPFADVEPAGAKTLGADKPRLTVDESRKLQRYCHAHAGDIGAVMTLAYLLLGMRATELTRRDVRDLDDGGRLLWIGATKSAAGRRRLAIPDELAPLLVKHALGRTSDAPLIIGFDQRRRNSGPRRMTRDQAYRHVRRITAAAGVPELGPQALRRTQATLATDAGETGLAVARHLGHATGMAPAVTHQSYVGRDAVVGARGERALRVIQGGRR